MFLDNRVCITGSGQGTLGQLLLKNPAFFRSVKDQSENGQTNYSAADIYSFVTFVIIVYQPQWMYQTSLGASYLATATSITSTVLFFLPVPYRGLESESMVSKRLWKILKLCSQTEFGPT
jgi:hypothetical protein